MLLEAIFDDNPVVFLEHRWLHNMQGNVPQEAYRLPLNKAQLLREGNDATIVSLSYMTVEALHATDALEKEGISCDLIDLRTVNPIDWESIETSLKKTGRLLVVDTASQTCSVASEIVAHCSIHFFDSLKKAPQRLALPDIPTPTSSYLTKEYYFGAQEIAQEVLKLVDQKSEIALCKQGAHDTPGDWFKGPF
jgi:pyruvate dehydrogenase E1 component beta subunit